MMVNDAWTKKDYVNPMCYMPIWIENLHGHVNLAWFIDGRFWPYGGDINDGRKPFKHGGPNAQIQGVLIF